MDSEVRFYCLYFSCGGLKYLLMGLWSCFLKMHSIPHWVQVNVYGLKFALKIDRVEKMQRKKETIHMVNIWYGVNI